MNILIIILAVLGLTVTPWAYAQTGPSDAILSDVTFQASVPSGQNVAGVQWYLDNAPFGAEDTTSPYTATVSLSSIAAGTHTMTARFRPSSGSIVSTQVFGFSSILPSTSPVPTPPAPSPAISTPQAARSPQGMESLGTHSQG